MGKSTTYQWPFSMSQTVSLPEGFMVFNILNMEQELFSSFDPRFEVEQWNQKREFFLSRIKIHISQDIPRKSCRDKPSLFRKTFDVKVHPSIGKCGSFQTWSAFRRERPESSGSSCGDIPLDFCHSLYPLVLKHGWLENPSGVYIL